MAKGQYTRTQAHRDAMRKIAKDHSALSVPVVRKHRAKVNVGGGVTKLAHVVVAERALGKRLPIGAEVHHVDEDKQNNAPANLVICEDHAYHHLLHVRARIVQAGGNPNTEAMCSMCQRLRPRSDFSVKTAATNGLTNYCRECMARYRKERH